MLKGDCATRYTPPVSGSEHIAREAGVDPSTIRRWAKLGLLPAGKKVHRGRRGTNLIFPDKTPAQAVWVKAQLDAGRTVGEVQEALLRGEYPPRAQAERETP